MTREDNAFFEEYKRLDRLCADLFSCAGGGVTAYLDEMDRADARGKARVPSWESDRKTLKHLRFVRNRIAHEANDTAVSQKEDLAAVKDYYSRILHERDPLALLRQAEKPSPRKAGTKTAAKKGNGRAAVLAMFIVVVLLVILGLLVYAAVADFIE